MILLVDDDEGFRSALAETLREDGYPVADYAAPAEVPPLETLGDVRVVVTDYDMPGTDGLTFAKRVHATRPDVPVIMITAYESQILQTRVAARELHRVLRKPLTPDELQDLLHELESVPIH